MLVKFKKKKFKLSRMLCNNPQKLGVVKSVRIVTPRKPNSARRSVVKLLLSTQKESIAFIPGSGHSLKKYSTVLVQGKGSRDLPGVYSRCVRGYKDLKGVFSKNKRRSIYGTKFRDYILNKKLNY